jgi:hypothetical protein
MIRHIVPFRLKHTKGSAEEAGFLAANRKLADIPGVEQFELLRQISPKNDFDFCVSMAFADQPIRPITITRTISPLSRPAGCPKWRTLWRLI